MSILIEKKDHIINRLSNLSDNQKKIIIDHLEQFPHKESMIDWNNQNLTWGDFAKVIANKSKTHKSKQVKLKGIQGLDEGKDYTIAYDNYPNLVVIPHSWAASVLIASKAVGGCEGKWCTAYKVSDYWDSYMRRQGSLLLYAIDFEKSKKVAMYYYGRPIHDVGLIPSATDSFDAADNSISTVDFLMQAFPNEEDPANVLMNILNKYRDLSALKPYRSFTEGDVWEGGPLNAEEDNFVWDGATFKDGIWQDGTWKGGLWEKGSWLRGTWERGTWTRGIWYDGTWKQGVWNGGLHLAGDWENGRWNGGEWHGGTWQHGWWDDGLWKKGTWEDGIWNGGTWEDGIWKGGMWQGGTWRKGTWLGGSIVNPNTGEPEYSEVDPDTYYYELRNSSNLEESLLTEKKDHIINKLKNLSTSQKKILIDHLEQFPHKESMIDWNNKELRWGDFAEMLASKSKSYVANEVKKKGIEGLDEHKDYELIYADYPVLVVMPLTYEASKLLASDRIAGCVGKWCTAYQQTPGYWNDYTKKGILLYAFNFEKHDKIALFYNILKDNYIFYSAKDTEISPREFAQFVFSQGNSDITEAFDQIKALTDKARQYRKDLNPKRFVKGDEFVGEWNGDDTADEWDGAVFAGEWQKGQWFSGDFMGGDWLNGEWYSGTWHDGTWHDGEWRDGDWKAGKWIDGSWWYGTWFSGIFGGGTWVNGVWMDGVWTGNATWNRGWIYDPERRGHVSQYTRTQGDFVESYEDPDTYFSYEDDSNKITKDLLQEKKDHIINRLPNLTTSQKKIIIDHLEQFPHKEKMIDWNNKDLKWEDFTELLATTSKTQKRTQVKKHGIKGLEEGRDYSILYDNYPILVVEPHHHEASVHIASKYVGGVEGKWCTAKSGICDYWNDYMKREGSLIMYAIDFEKQDKMALVAATGDDDYFPKTESEFYKYHPMYAYNRNDDLVAWIAFLDFIFKGTAESFSDKAIDAEHRALFFEILKKAFVAARQNIVVIKVLDSEFEWTGGPFDIRQMSATWDGASFFNGTWKGGVWKAGRWYNGTWEGGVWEDGIWYSGTWKDGVWEGGTFGGGTWLDGTWQDGRFSGDVWHKGIWQEGRWLGKQWKNGTWMDGEWNDGEWLNGTWQGGLWHAGIWRDGVWKNGIWRDGFWKGGTWLDGEWVKGWIMHPDTKEYVESTEDPATFYNMIEYQKAIQQPLRLKPFAEKKDHIINKLHNLSAGQKKILIDHLNQFPHKESMIDWNRKDLAWDDFAELLATVSKTQKQVRVKKQGIKGLEEGKDYTVVYDNYPVLGVAPHSWEASALIASKSVGGCEGKWCTAYQKSADYWNDYMAPDNTVLLYFINFDKQEKMACYFQGEEGDLRGVLQHAVEVYDQNDERRPLLDLIVFVFGPTEDKRDYYRGQEKLIDMYHHVLVYADIVRIYQQKYYGPDDTWVHGTLNNERGDIEWNGASFLGGTFINAKWQAGTWYGGIWRDGEWDTGHWHHGVWENGYWKAGAWIDGQWNDGTWFDGKWFDGIWKRGTWYDGVWQDGLWVSGVHHDGEWLRGRWLGGEWNGGVWHDGTWYGGEWKGGEWVRGQILVDKDKQLFAFSTVDPVTYYKQNNIQLDNTVTSAADIIKNRILSEYAMAKLTLQEKKDHIIKKLPNLTDGQKRILIAHLEQFPHKESWIDWNNKELRWEDFAELLASTSKTQKQAQVKKRGLKGLEEGEDYVVLYDEYPALAVLPLHHEASVLIASKNVANCEGKWCTAYQKSNKYWKSYITNGPLIYIINFEQQTKVAVHHDIDLPKTTFYNSSDDTVHPILGYAVLLNTTPNDIMDSKELQKKALKTFRDVVWKADEVWDALPRAYGRGDDFTGTWDADKTGNTWDGAFFKNGEWLSGTFEDGVFANGTFLGGTWQDGVFASGVFDGGEWLNGRFMGGEFRSGVWHGGVWQHGLWSGGTWKGGWIYDPRFEGNLKSDWKKSTLRMNTVDHNSLDAYNAVYSPIDPARYFAKNK